MEMKKLLLVGLVLINLVTRGGAVNPPRKGDILSSKFEELN